MIFILGGRGFVGSAISRHCELRGLEYRAITRSNYAEHAGKRCDVLVNADGNSSRLLGARDPVADFEASVFSVKRSLSDFEFGRYVLASSCDVYPDCSSPEATAEDSTIDVAAQMPYGFHKHLAELCVMHGCAGGWLILRLGGMVGAGLKKNPIYDIMNGGPLWVSPRSRLQYMNTDDVARIAFSLMDGGATGVFNVCGRGRVIIGDLPGAASCEVRGDAPVADYDVSIAKAAGMADIPDSRDAVDAFMRGNGA